MKKNGKIADQVDDIKQLSKLMLHNNGYGKLWMGKLPSDYYRVKNAEELKFISFARQLPKNS